MADKKDGALGTLIKKTKGKTIGTTHKKATKEEIEKAKKNRAKAITKGASSQSDNNKASTLKESVKNVGDKYNSYAEKFRTQQEKDIKNAPKKIEEAKNKAKETKKGLANVIKSVKDTEANSKNLQDKKASQVEAQKKAKEERAKASLDAYTKYKQEGGHQTYDTVRDASTKSQFENGQGKTSFQEGYKKILGSGAYKDDRKWGGSTKPSDTTIKKAKNTDVNGVYHDPDKPEMVDTNLGEANAGAKKQFDIDVRRKYDNAFSSEKELKKFFAEVKDEKGNPIYSDADIKNMYEYFSQNREELEKMKKEWIANDKEYAYKEIDKAIPLQTEKQYLNSNEFAHMLNNLNYNPMLRQTALANNKDLPNLAEKLGNIEAQQYLTKGGRIVSGVIEGASVTPINNGVSNTGAIYNDTASAMIQAGQNTWAYRGGYMGGMLGMGALTGATGLEASMLETGLFKLGASSTAKNIAKKRLVDGIVNAPIDIIDSVKTSYTEDGHLDGKELAKNLGINLGASALFGGATEGIGAMMKSAQMDKLAKIMHKMNNGMELDASDYKLLNKLQGKDKTGYLGYDAKVKEAGEKRLEYEAEQVSKKADEVKAPENVTGEVDVVAGTPKKSTIDRSGMPIDEANKLADEMRERPRPTQPYGDSPEAVAKETSESFFENVGAKKPKLSPQSKSDLVKNTEAVDDFDVLNRAYTSDKELFERKYNEVAEKYGLTPMENHADGFVDADGEIIGFSDLKAKPEKPKDEPVRIKQKHIANAKFQDKVEWVKNYKDEYGLSPQQAGREYDKIVNASRTNASDIEASAKRSLERGEFDNYEDALKFYREVYEDSKNLNVTENRATRDKLIDEAVAEVNGKKSSDASSSKPKERPDEEISDSDFDKLMSDKSKRNDAKPPSDAKASSVDTLEAKYLAQDKASRDLMMKHKELSKNVKNAPNVYGKALKETEEKLYDEYGITHLGDGEYADVYGEVIDLTPSAKMLKEDPDFVNLHEQYFQARLNLDSKDNKIFKSATETLRLARKKLKEKYDVTDTPDGMLVNADGEVIELGNESVKRLVKADGETEVFEPKAKKPVEVKKNVPAKDYNTGVFVDKKVKKAGEQLKKTTEANKNAKPNKVPPRMRTTPASAKTTVEVARKNSVKELDDFNKGVAGGDYTGFATADQVKQFKKEMRNAKSLSPNRPIEHLTLGNLRETAKYIKRKIFNDLQGFDNVAKDIGDISVRESTLSVVNDVRKAFSKARHSIIGTKRYDFNGNEPSGDSLNGIYMKAGLDNDLRKRNHFELYAVLQQHIDELNQGGKILGSMGRNEAEKLLADLEIVYGNEIKQYHKDIVGYGRYLLKYRLDAGLISKEDYNHFLDMHPNYVPVMRVGDIDNFKFNDNVTSTLGVSNQIHTRVGSDMNIIPLYDSLSSQTMAIVQSAHTNRMIDHIAKVWNIDGSPVVKEAFKDGDPSKWETALNSVPRTKRKGGDYVISFYRNGENVSLKVNKEMYYGLQDFANNNNSEMFEFLEKNGVFDHNPMPKINNIYKSLITDYNIIFGIRNFSRDFGTAMFTTKNLRGYIKSVPEAIKQITKNGELYKLYMANGGLYSNFVNGKTVDMNVHGLQKAWKNTLDGSLGRIAELNNFIETIPRMTEFINALDEFTKSEALVTTKNLTKEDITKAMYRANDVTVNFSRSGKWGRMASTNFVPFLNASLQGMDKLIRVFSETGYGKTGAKKIFNQEMASVVAKATAFGIAPSVINEFLLAGNEDYQWLTDRDKDNYYLFPLGDGEFLKVPKSRETSVLAFPFTYPMRYAMYGKKNGDNPITEWHNCFEDTWDLVGPVNPFKDNIFSGVINVAHNKTYFGGDINYKEDLELIADGKNYLAYDESTSEVAKWLGKKLNRSPKSIDKLMDNYLGFIYDMGIKPNSAKYHSDASTNTEKLRNWAVTVGKTNFIVDALFSTKVGDTYWTKLDSLDDGEEKYRLNANYTGDITSYSDAIHFMLNRQDLTVADKTAKARELRRLRFEVYTDGVHGRTNNGNAWANICRLLATDKDKYGVRTFFTNADFMGVDEEHEGSSWGKAFTNLAMSDEYKNASNNEKFKMEKEFLDQYNSVHKICRKIGCSDFFADYMVLAVDSVLNKRSGAVNDAILKDANQYDYVAKAQKYGGFGRTLDDFVKTQKQNFATAWGLGVEYPSKLMSGQRGLGLATSNDVYIDTEYMISGSSSKVNPARCLGNKYGWTNEKYAKFLSDNKFDNDSDPAKVEKAIRQLNLGEEESSALFRLTVNDFKVKNPWGEVNGYGIAGDKGISNWGGYGRRHRRRHWSHGWGKYSGVTNNYSKWLKQHTTSKSKPKHKSSLNDAFRKKQLENLRNTTGTLKTK